MPVRDKAGLARFLRWLHDSKLEELFRQVAGSHRVSLEELYLDRSGQAVMAARVEVWWWLTARYGRTSNGVGEVMDRDGSSIRYAMRQIYILADSLQRDVEESTIHALAVEWCKRSNGKGPRRGTNIEAARRGGLARQAQLAAQRAQVSGSGRQGNDIVAEKKNEETSAVRQISDPPIGSAGPT